MASLFDDELERQRKQLEGVGVNQAMVDAAGLLPVAAEPPKHWLEQARERDGNGKFFGKMLLGGMTGMMPFVFPEGIGGNARYKAELEQYYDAQERLKELQELSGIDMSDPSVVDVARMTDANGDLGDFVAGNLIGNQNRDTTIAEVARKAGMTYEQFMGLGTEVRENLMYQFGSDEYRANVDILNDIKTPEEEAAAAGLKVTAEETARAEVQDSQTLKSQTPQMEVGFNILSDVLSGGDYDQIYGTIDSRTPTLRQSSQDVKTKIDKVSAILYMFARGELKGQGQVTEDEAAWAMKSRSSLQDFKQGDEAAMREMMLIQRQLGEKLGITDESRYFNPDLSVDDLVEMYTQ